MNMAEHVEIVEMAARDGLQNEKRFVPTADKIALIDRLSGCGYARIDDSKHYLKHKQHAHLGFMYVVPHYRGKGVNKLIIEKLKQWAQQRDIAEIRLEVYAANNAALKAYEKAGFAGHMLTMRMNLNEEAKD